MAAGGGARYGGLKQMEPFGPGGEAIVEYSIYDARREGFDKVVFVIRRQFEKEFRTAVGQRVEKNIDVHYGFQEDLVPALNSSLQRTKPWGTGHAVLSAADLINEPFAVINADDFYGREPFRLLGQYMETETEDSAMVGFQLQNTLSDFGAVKRGLCSVEKGLLRGVEEIEEIRQSSGIIMCVDARGNPRKLRGDEIVSMNVWAFNVKMFNDFSIAWEDFLRTQGQSESAEFYLPNVVNQFVVDGLRSCRVMETSSSWFGVTYPRDRPSVVGALSRHVQSGDYPPLLWS